MIQDAMRKHKRIMMAVLLAFLIIPFVLSGGNFGASSNDNIVNGEPGKADDSVTCTPQRNPCGHVRDKCHYACDPRPPREDPGFAGHQPRPHSLTEGGAAF